MFVLFIFRLHVQLNVQSILHGSPSVDHEHISSSHVELLAQVQPRGLSFSSIQAIFTKSTYLLLSNQSFHL